MSEGQLTRRAQWRVALLLLAFALIVRLAFLPFATLDTGDTAARIWLGWRWIDDPYLITNGLWGPLHFYLIGTILRLWPDPVWAPIALHVAIGSLIPIIAYRFTFDLFDSRRSAIAAGLIFAVYPAAIAVSLGARAETPFMFFLGLGLVGLVRAWRPDGRLLHAVLAGLAVTLASMIRYEAWLLLPFLVLLLARKPKLAAAFLATAMIHPVFWMIGNTLAFGNPLHSLLATSSWLQDVMAHDPDTSLLPGVGRIARLFGRTALEMTFPVALLIAIGVVRALRQKRIEAFWLVPPLGLFLLFAVSAFRDSMTIKAGYTTTFGLLLIPFVACALDRLGIERWSRARCLASAAVFLAAIGLFMYEPAVSRLPLSSWFSADPVPSIPDVESVRRLQALVDRAGLRLEDDALVSDFFGLLATPYVAWQTRLHPAQICRASGASNIQLTTKQLQGFLVENRSGVLITRPGGDLTSHVQLESERSGSLADIPLRLEPIGVLDWESRDRKQQIGRLSVFRYEVVGSDELPEVAPLQCSYSCPIGQCR